jgi:hypothetical protein
LILWFVVDDDNVGDDYYPRLQATRAFAIMSILTSLGGSALAFMEQFLPATGAFGVTAFFGLLSTAIYASKF